LPKCLADARTRPVADLPELQVSEPAIDAVE